MTAFDIVAYDFKGERLCPSCVIGAIPTGPGEAYDGWADAIGEMGAEEFLQGIADAFQIDRVNPRTYTAGQFPKVVFRGHVHGLESCEACGNVLA